MLSLVVSGLSLSPLSSKFESWKRAEGKSYATVEEESAALNAFAANDAIINDVNSKNLSYWLGHNSFSDMTWEDFQRTHMGELYLNSPPKNMVRKHLDLGDKVADAVDWVEAGAVTPVKNQQRCGSCWAFSTTGSVEGAFQIANKQLISLSEEDLVQCDHNGDNGCKGGLMDNAFKWIHMHGIAAEADYPYTSGGGVTGQCKAAKEKKPVVTISSFRDVPKGDEDALKSAVAIGPVSIAIEADKSAFQLYKGGVLDNKACGTQLDHGVLIVGFGTDSSLGKDYWKVKNSWGATWGESGYIRMVRNKNQCGLANSASYPKGATKAGPLPPPSPSPPSPTPPSPTPPTPPSPTKHHYNDPKDGCATDETEITIKGVKGDFCSPKCKLFKPCPTDKPAGVLALPQCALQDASSGDKYCALICAPTLPILDQKAADMQCGKNASCKALEMGLGVCTYDD